MKRYQFRIGIAYPEPPKGPDMNTAEQLRVLRADDDEDYDLSAGVPPDGYKLALRQLQAASPESREREAHREAIRIATAPDANDDVYANPPDGWAIALKLRAEQ